MMIEMRDLIYAGDEYKEEMMLDFQKRWDDIVIENASDQIHEGRFEVSFELEEEEDYLIWLFETGIFHFSFHAQAIKMEDTEYYTKIIKRVVQARGNE